MEGEVQLPRATNSRGQQPALDPSGQNCEDFGLHASVPSCYVPFDAGFNAERNETDRSKISSFHPTLWPQNQETGNATVTSLPGHRFALCAGLHNRELRRRFRSAALRKTHHVRTYGLLPPRQCTMWLDGSARAAEHLRTRALPARRHQRLEN